MTGDDLITLAAQRGLLDEPSARRALAGRDATLQLVVKSGVLDEPTAKRLLAENRLTHCGWCGRPLHADGAERVCPPCGIRVSPASAAFSSEQGAALALPDAARDPANLYGPYVALRELGRGGFGAVHLAYDTRLSRLVALKVPRFDDPDDLARFKREALVAASLNHPNVAQVYEVGEARGRMYLAMQYIDGETAAAAEHALLRAVVIVRDAARGVAAAHERGIVHRDLKPSNLMIDRAGQVFVMDFGLAKGGGRPGEAVTQSGIMGTPAFMAPEQARGDPLDGRADVYSLGATLYALVTGRVPFEGKDAEVITRVLLEEPPAPRRVRRGVPREVEVIIQKAMAKEPARRYATAAELADDLDRYMRGEPLRARPAGAAYRMRKRIGRNPSAWGLGAAAAAILVAGAAFLLFREQGFRLSTRASEAIASAREALLEWRLERYTLPHDVTPTRRKVEAAIGRLEGALAIQPEAHPARAMKGWAHLALGQTARAREALERAAREAPGEGSYRWWLGRAYLATRDDAAAAALQIENEADRRRALEAADEWREKADAEIRAAVGSATWAAEAWERDLARAFLLWRDGQTDRAREACERLAAEHRHGGEEAWALAGEMAATGEDRAACHDRAIERAPSWTAAYAAAARSWVSWGKEIEDRGGAPEEVNPIYDRAVELAGTGTEVDREAAEIWLHRGIARATWGTYRMNHGEDPMEPFHRADEDFGQAIALDREMVDAWWARAFVLLNMGVYQADHGGDPTELYRRAIEEGFDPAIRLAPRLARAWMGRGLTRANWGRHVAGRGEDPTELFRRAIDEDLERAVRLDPAYAEAWTSRGLARINWGLYLHGHGEDPTVLYRQAVEEDLERAIRLSASSAEPWMVRGMALTYWAVHLAEQGRDPAELYRRAIDEDFEEAIRLNPESAKAWLHRGSARVNWARHVQALGGDPTELYRRAVDEDFEEAIRLNPEFAEAWASRGLARLNWGAYLAARGEDPTELYRRAVEEDFERSVRLNPGSADTWLRRGMARVNWGNYLAAHGEDPVEFYRRAIDEDFAGAIRLNPGSAEAWMRRGQTRGNWGNYLAHSGGDPTGQYRQAIDEDYARALDLNPESAESWAGRANAAGTLAGYLAGARGAEEAAADFVRADEWFTRAIELNRQGADARWRRGFFRLQSGRAADALADFAEAVRLNPALAEPLRPHIERARRALWSDY